MLSSFMNQQQQQAAYTRNTHHRLGYHPEYHQSRLLRTQTPRLLPPHHIHHHYPMRTLVNTIPARSTTVISTPAEEIKYPPHKISPELARAHRISPQKIKKAKYATSVDERGFLSIYEFQLNEHTIMWDYTTGFVHLTGIWKALGNSKADVVRLIDNHPELEGVIRRIRGGYLKIQGTWVPYDLALSLAQRTAYHIRYSLVTVFGPDFPESCLPPDAPGFGILSLSDPEHSPKRRRRRIQQVTRNPVYHPQPQQSPDTESIAPPLPTQIVLEETNIDRFKGSADLLEMLRAGRCLQQLSVGGTFSDSEQGGPFGFNGRRYLWDGKMDGTGGLLLIEDDYSEDSDGSERLSLQFTVSIDEEMPGLVGGAEFDDESNSTSTRHSATIKATEFTQPQQTSEIPQSKPITRKPFLLAGGIDVMTW